MIRSAKIRELLAELPGHTLLMTYRAGAPVRELSIDVRVVAKERVTAIQELVMKCLSHDVPSVATIGMVLGVSNQLIVRTLGYLHSFDLVEEKPVDSPSTVEFQLTDRGRQALVESAVRVSQIVTLSCVADGVTGELTLGQSRNRFRSLGQLGADAVHPLPACAELPEIHEVDKGRVRVLVAQSEAVRAGGRWDGEVVEVARVAKRQEKHRIVDVAVFDDGAGGLVLRVVDRGARLKEYEQSLMVALETQPEVLPTEIAPTAGSTALAGGWLDGDERKAAKQMAEQLAEIQERLGEVDSQLLDVPDPTNSADTVSTREQLDLANRERDVLRRNFESLEKQIEEGLCLIDTEEHRRLLERAFKHAKERVIVVSPWLSPDAVDAEFKRWLAGALARGVEVIIGWGYPEGDNEEGRRKSDRSRTIAGQLLKLSSAPASEGKSRRAINDSRGQLRIVELGDTHEKILVADKNFAVVSSFNFLSFRGSKRVGELAIRQERGYRIGIPGRVQQIAEDVMRRIGIGESRAASA